MVPRVPRSIGAALLALAAAFLWAAYYPLVLAGARGVAPIALLAWPFVAGGAGFTLIALVSGDGPSVRRAWIEPAAWGRTGLLVAMQALVLASTYLAGAIDTALLVLIGDVVFTPLLLVLLYREGSGQVRSARFAIGIAVCTSGAVLTIAAGGAVRPLSGSAVAVAAAVPIVIAIFFLAMAKATIRAPTSAVAGQAALGAGLVVLAIAPFAPGGVSELTRISAGALVSLIAIGVTAFWLGQWLYFAAIQRAGIVLPAVLMAAIPVFTLLLAWIVLGSTPPPLGLAGIPIAVAGAVLAVRGENVPWTPTYSIRDRSGSKPEG